MKRHFYCFLILLAVLSNNTAFSQSRVPNLQSPVKATEATLDTTGDTAITIDSSNLVDSTGDTASITNADAENENQDNDKSKDWGELTYRVNFADLIATVLGFLAAIVTLLVMRCTAKRESDDVQQQISLLKESNQQAEQQIQNQNRALKDSAEKSRKLNAALKGNVEDIKKYLTQSDLKVKLTEKEDSVISTFTSLWNSVLRHGGSKIKDGSIINNPAVLNGIIMIESGINTFNDLLPVASNSCSAAGKICLDDIGLISKKKKKGEDIAQWLQDMKSHFEDLNNEMSKCIKNIK